MVKRTGDAGQATVAYDPRVRAATLLIFLATALTVFFFSTPASGHGMADQDAAFVSVTRGPEVLAFIYLGAKHMVTGYDHLLFIVGVIFFLYRLPEVALYVTMFSIGHSVTLLAGVLGGIRMDPHLIVAIIGLSVAYKAFDNLGGLQTLFGVQPNQKLVVLLFGLCHGFGLATKLVELNPPADGLLANMLAFNVGVELGQLLALSLILTIMVWWRTRPSFATHARAANALLLCAGFLLIEYQLAGFFLQGGSR